MIHAEGHPTSCPYARDVVAMMKRLWAKAPCGFDGESAIAFSDHDQSAITDNPLWSIVRLLPAEQRPSRSGLDLSLYGTAHSLMSNEEYWMVYRTRLCVKYTWSIPSPVDVAWIKATVDGRGIVEVAAGSGYWAWQLRQLGVDVVAYDPNPSGMGNEYTEKPAYTQVIAHDPGDLSTVVDNPDRVLMMVWPPYNLDVGRANLAAYKGDMLIYAGEPAGGCTADGAFYDLLSREWDLVDESPGHVTWSGIHCHLGAYRRK